MEKLLIGPSTGWLYAVNIYSLKLQKEILKKSNSNSFEVVLGGWDKDDKRLLSLKQNEKFEPNIFAYRSIHLSDVENENIDNQIAVAKEAVDLCKAHTAVSHVLKINGEYPIKACEQMINAGVRLAVENMDSRKDSGFLLTDLVRIAQTLDCPFVLDVQHAYEHDHSMKYARDLFEHLQKPLVHLHVSGETPDNIHSLVHKAHNTTEIVEFVGYVFSNKKVPLILEGEYENADELSQEIKFLKRELGI